MVIRRTIIFVCVWSRILSPVSADHPKESLTGNASDLPFSIDFANPINVPAVKMPHAAVKPSRSVWLREERNAPIVLFHNDGARLQQISLIEDEGGRRNANNRMLGEEGMERRTSMKVRFNGKINNERARDRFLHSKSNSESLNVNKFQSPSYPKWSRTTNDLQKKIKLEREDEIKREVQKSFELREKILRGKEMQKISNKVDWSGRDRKLNSIVSVTTPFNAEVTSIDKDQRERDRAVHSKDGRIPEKVNIIDQRARDRFDHSKDRMIPEEVNTIDQRARDRFDHSKDRLMPEEVNIIDQRARDRASHEKGNSERDRGTYNHDRRRLPHLKNNESSARRQDQLSKRLGDPGISIERREKERRDRISLAVRNNLNGRYKETPHRNDYYNSGRPNYGMGVQKHTSERYQNYPNIKPPILIMEKIPVPVAVVPYTEEGTIVQSPISSLYDERGAGKPDEGFYMDRRPERPGTSPHDNSEESIHVEEGFIIGPSHPIHFAQGPLHFGNIQVNPNEVAEIAIANHVAHAGELEKLNQAATLSEIARLNRIKLAHAIHEHLNAEGLATHVANKQVQMLAAHAAHAQVQTVAEHVANNQAQAFAAHAHAQDALEQVASNQAIIAHAINAAQAHAANSHVEAVVENASPTQALSEQSVLKDTLKDQLLLRNRFVDNQGEISAAATEVDLINLAIKNGIKEALKTQISNHLKNKIITSEFFHHLHAIKDELLQRLELLRPYFQSDSGEYLVPEEIPLLSHGTPLHSHELQNLPKVHLSPVSLITPGYSFPKDMLLDANNNMDIRFVEYVLRLPEPQFSEVMQIPKGEFLLALFPRLYREVFIDSSFNHDLGFPQPNEPKHDPDIGKNIQHNHYHIHRDSPASTSSKHSQTIQPDFKVAFAENHFRQHDGSKFLSFTPSPQSNNPISEYRESSYVSYDPKLFGRQDETNYSSLYHGQIDVTTPKPYTALTIKHFLTTAAPNVTPVINGIQVRPKGYGTHHYSSTPISKEINIQQDIWTNSSPPGIFRDTSELSVLPNSDQVQNEPHGFPLHKHSITKTISHSITKGYTPIPTIPQQIVTNSGNYIIRLPKPNSLDEDIITLSEELATITPFKHPPINNYIPHRVTPFSVIETSTPSYAFPTSYSDIPTTIFNNSQTITFSQPHSTTLYHPGETFKLPTFNAWPFETTIFTKDPEDESSKIEGISTFGSPESPLFTSITESPLASAPVVPQENSFEIIPFGGFSGNIRQKTIFEKLAEQVDRENELTRPSGTDKNDDDHVVSIFQKKKGNATDPTAQMERSKFNHSKKQSKNSGQLSEEERRRLGINNFRGDMPRTSNELIIDKIKEITRATPARPQETLTVVKIAGVISKPIENQFFPDLRHNLSDSNSDDNTIYPTQDQLPTSTEATRSSKQYNTRLLDFSDRPAIPDDNVLKGSKRNRSHAASSRKPPRPRRVESTPTPFVDINRTPNWDSLTLLADAVGVTAEPYLLTTKDFTSITENVLKELPSYLRTEPACSVTGTIKRAFCLYPAGYPRYEAEKLVGKYKKVIKDGIELLKSLPEPNVNLKVAQKQLPHLNLTVSCETENKIVQLSWSKDALGSWLTVLQSGSFQQVVNITTCGSSARIKGCQPLLQPRPLIAFHPDNQNARPLILEFPLPVGCVFVSQK